MSKLPKVIKNSIAVKKNDLIINSFKSGDIKKELHVSNKKTKTENSQKKIETCEE